MTYLCGAEIENAQYIFYLHIFISWKKGRGGGAVQ